MPVFPATLARGSIRREAEDGAQMAKPDAVFIFVGTYPDREAARHDYDVVKALHAGGVVGTYDAAVVTKDEGGKIHINKDELATRHGAWGGAAVGALVGILFPPSIVATTLVGASVGSVSGHLWKGMSRADVKELGEIIDDGQAALMVIGEGRLEEQLQKSELKAQKRASRTVDVDAKDVDKAVEETAKEVS
jgi:uncharacterized membrane protein